jgi:uncharacterized membrane protein YdbT with pleckstrin-like domain
MFAVRAAPSRENLLGARAVSYIGKNLVPGEAVLYRTGCHWIVLVWPILVGAIIGSLASVFLASAYLGFRKGSPFPGMAIVGTLAGLVTTVVIGRGLIRRVGTEVAVSNRRVAIKTGLLSRKSIEVLLPKVESIGVDESLFGRMLGYGSVIVRGTGGTLETFDKIAHPNELRRQVQEQIVASESR